MFEEVLVTIQPNVMSQAFNRNAPRRPIESMKYKLKPPTKDRKSIPDVAD